MWVIFNVTTGYEIDRVETIKERKELIESLEENNLYCYEYSYRWED
jgi:hypothetical protein